MASVYRVRHRSLGTPHALKVLSVPMGAATGRLLQEGRVQAGLQHPNILNVVDVVEVQGCPGLVMEYVPGPTLQDLLERHRLTLDQVDSLAQGLLAGVGFAHRRGIVHRDLKPGNVLLLVTDDGIVPKIADFGLVKFLGDVPGDLTRTRSGQVMGTPMYMSPEQFRDSSRVDAATDVFALGVMLYEMVCGQRPFAGSDLLEVFQAVVGGLRIGPRELVPDLPDRVDAAIRGALETDSAARIPNGDTLLAIWNGHRVWGGLGTVSATRSQPWGATLFSELSSERSLGELFQVRAESPVDAHGTWFTDDLDDSGPDGELLNSVPSLAPAAPPLVPRPEHSAESLAPPGPAPGPLHLAPGIAPAPVDRHRAAPDTLVPQVDALSDSSDGAAAAAPAVPLRGAGRRSSRQTRALVAMGFGSFGAGIAMLLTAVALWPASTPVVSHSEGLPPVIGASAEVTETAQAPPGAPPPAPAEVKPATRAVPDQPPGPPRPRPGPSVKKASGSAAAARVEERPAPTPSPGAPPAEPITPVPIVVPVAIPAPVVTPPPLPTLVVFGVPEAQVSVRNAKGVFSWPGDPLAPGSYEILLDTTHVAGTFRVTTETTTVSIQCDAALRECR